MTEGKGHNWIKAGFAELARSGVKGVRSRCWLAKNLGVTKGGFYQSLLFLERGPSKRAELVAKSAEKLFDDSG